MNAVIAHRPLTPGEVVLREFSLGEVAAACGISESTVWRWAQPVGKGTGGVVPSRYHLVLLQLARQLGRELTAEELVLGRHA